MKNLGKNLFVVGAVLMALALGAQAAGPVGGLLAAGATYSVFQAAGLVEIPVASFWTLTSFTSVKRRARQEDNLGGIVKILIVSEEDFTDNWPKKADVTAGEVTLAPPLVTGKSFANMVFDVDSSMIKINRKGELGYQNYGIEGGAKLSGVSKEQFTALGFTTNCGAVVIAEDAEGRKWVLGTRRRPLTIEYDSNWGTKADDKKQIDIKFKGDGYAFAVPELATATVIPVLVEA
jgi:hypothetical protein